MTAKKIKAILACAAAMVSLAAAALNSTATTDARPFMATPPAYWGVERRAASYRDCCGWRWTRLNPREASIRQLNPRLRARSDGRLLEEVGAPPQQQPEPVVIWPDSAAPGLVIPPWAFKWYGAKRWHHALQAAGSADGRGRGASGSGRRAR